MGDLGSSAGDPRFAWTVKGLTKPESDLLGEKGRQVVCCIVRTPLPRNWPSLCVGPCACGRGVFFMCGIMGYAGPRDALEVVLDGLQRLEYRGYDSAGVAVASNEGVAVVKRAGPLRVLRAALSGSGMPRARFGIGHTRWATHGGVTDHNAHPHTDCANRIAIVHNGIIENAPALRAEVLARGHRLTSETDSELVAHLLEDVEGDLLERLQHVAQRCEGAYALLVIDSSDPERLCAVRRTSPITIGMNDDEVFIASGSIAIAPWVDRCIHLDDGEIADLRPGYIAVRRLQDLTPIEKAWHAVVEDGGLPDAGTHGHFYLKEMHDQPSSWRSTLTGRLSPDGAADISETGLSLSDIRSVRQIVLLAMGSSLHASQLAAERLGRWAGLGAQAELASEFVATRRFLEPGTLAIAVSQSGETIDTLTALRHARNLGAKGLAVVNAPGSTIWRESDYALDLRAGPEISVASTKAFTTQSLLLQVMAIAFAQARGQTVPEDVASALLALPGLAEDYLSSLKLPEELVRRVAQAPGVAFIGRGQDLSLAREGSLKLKELSYIWSEAYAAGELKHGPLALVDSRVPVFVPATDPDNNQKLSNSIAQARARGGYTVAIGSEDLPADICLSLPMRHGAGAYILGALPLHLLAFAAAQERGCPIDQPRNLAKSVTVE